MNKFTGYLRSLVSLSDYIDKDAASVTIRKNIQFKGPNVFILACAIIIASVGLNVNSIPVIIGAMLISPVMGPIIGLGLGLGTRDSGLVKSSLKNFGVMIAISIVASTLYFLISPLNMAHQTELLARTRPTIYDVLIALFGGIAGLLEVSRKEKGTVLSGVAIATALMPPLCTVGYGLSIFNWQYVLGALYLFIINSVFIALATFIMVKYLEFPKVSADDPTKRMRTQWVAIFLLAMIIPSCLTAFNVIRENNFSSNAYRFVDANKTLGRSYIYDHKINVGKGDYNVELYIAGESLEPMAKEVLFTSAEKFGLKREQVIIRQEAASQSMSETEFSRNLYEYYDGRIQELNRTITELQLELAKYRSADPNYRPADAESGNSKPIADSTAIAESDSSKTATGIVDDSQNGSIQL